MSTIYMDTDGLITGEDTATVVMLYKIRLDIRRTNDLVERRKLKEKFNAVLGSPLFREIPHHER